MEEKPRGAVITGKKYTFWSIYALKQREYEKNNIEIIFTLKHDR